MYAVIKAAQDDSGIQIDLREVKRFNGDGTEVSSTVPLVHQSRPLDRSRSDQDLCYSRCHVCRCISAAF